MNNFVIGPKLTDEIFFGKLLNLDFEGLENIKAPLEKGNYAACRKIFAEFFRNFLKPDVYFSTKNEGEKIEATNELIEKAEEAYRHYVICCGTPYDFEGREIDWEFNPTFNGFVEWPFVLNRHSELLTLARAYRATKNEKYAFACAELLDSWIKNAVAPPEGTSWGATICHRTIECGIRLFEVWPEIIHSLYKTEAFTDDLIVDICKSIWEQARRSRFEHREKGNWLIYALSGVCFTAITMPFLKDKDEWLNYALETLNRELKRQVHPDGFQFELSTGYQYDVIICFVNVLQVLNAYGHGYDKDIAYTVEKLLEIYPHLTMPNGKVPDINDGEYFNTKEILSPYVDLFPENQLFKWVLSDKKDGMEPDKHHIFENAGLGVLRTGWSENDTYLFFDGGEFAAGHQHEDKLNLLLYADNKLILTEGGNYAYDTSDMRLHVRSTKAHNTIIVDSKNQHRGKNYQFPDTSKISDLKGKFTDKIDSFTSFYNEGYGENAENFATHTRNVYFIKNEEGLKPFVIVADRLASNDEKEHLYTALWHIDSDNLHLSGTKIKADTLNLFASGENISVNVVRGQLYPEVQGFFCSCEQLQYRPIYCAEYSVFSKDTRLVTLFYPDGNEVCPIDRIEASSDIGDNIIKLIKTNGEILVYNENEMI